MFKKHDQLYHESARLTTSAAPPHNPSECLGVQQEGSASFLLH